MKVVTHPFFGRLTYDKDIGVFSGTVLIQSTHLEVLFDVDETAELTENRLTKGSEIMGDFARRDLQARQYGWKRLGNVVKKWNSSGTVKESDFLDKLKPLCVSFQINGSWSIEYDSGGLLTDHHVTVEFDKRSRPVDASF